MPIETVLERLLEVAPDYNWDAKAVTVQFDAGKWGAVVQGTLEIDGKRAAGFGAMTNPDPDMAIKSANSEAMKNAAKNGWGISLELWNEEHRNKLAQQRRLSGGSVSALKAEVFTLAIEKTGVERPTASAVAEVFGVKPGELADPDVLRGILEREGVL